MAEDPGPDGTESTAVPTETDDEVETYQTEDGVVFYDAGNPLAWIESHTPVRLDDAA